MKLALLVGLFASIGFAAVCPFTPKYLHVPEIKAYYDVITNDARFCAPGTDFFDVLDIPAGWAATQLCSAIFVTGLPEETGLAEDVSIVRYLVDINVDYEEKSVTAELIDGLGYPAKAIYREGAGCTLVDGMTEEELRAQELGDLTPPPALNESALWPYGDFVDFDDIPDGVDMDALEAIADEQFRHPIWNTRAMLVVYKGQIVFERYAVGIDKTMPLIGWSMTKSVTSAFVGLLTEDVDLDISKPIPVPEWQGPLDSRQNITWTHMLHFLSGLRYWEVQVIFCLFDSGGDCANWYAERRVRNDPGTYYEYSTGSTTTLMRTVMQQRDHEEWTNFEYPRRRLFERVNMNTAFIETQAVGSYPLGGSNMFATVRDWARFGHLYMNAGVWDGQQIMPKGWTDFTCTGSSVNSGYGAQWGVKRYSGYQTCLMNGFRNQNVFNVFAKQLTVVRLAMPGLILSETWDRTAFIESVIACFDDAI